MKMGLGRGLDSLLKVYDEEVKNEKQERSITNLEMRQGEVQKIDLNESNNWQYIFTNLPIKKDGQDIVYTIVENTKIDGYTSTIKLVPKTIAASFKPIVLRYSIFFKFSSSFIVLITTLFHFVRCFPSIGYILISFIYLWIIFFMLS